MAASAIGARLQSVNCKSLRLCSTGFRGEKQDIQDGGEVVSMLCNDNASKPAIDAVRFTQTPLNTFWSSSPNVSDGSRVWYVDFSNGAVSGGGNRDGGIGHLRLVRASQ